MRIQELFETKRSKKSIEVTRDHVIIRFGYALEPFLYSKEEAHKLANDKDVVLPIRQALYTYARDPHIARDLAKMASTLKEALEPKKFLKPGELRGSYTKQQLLDMGFRLSANGYWYISMSKFKALVAAGKIK